MANTLYSLSRFIGLKQSLNNVRRYIFRKDSISGDKFLSVTHQNRQMSLGNLSQEGNVKYLPMIFNTEVIPKFKEQKVHNTYDFPAIQLPLNIIDPLKIYPIFNENIDLDKFVDLPTRGEIIEKHAHRMIVIRRKKMKKHKRIKLIKKMIHEWRKRKMRRKLQKEKIFRAELAAQMRNAENFKAEQYVSERLEILSRQKPDIFWRGELLPEAQVKEFIEKKRLKKEAKCNKPRLTLD